MKNQKLTFAFVGILALVLTLSVVSAEIRFLDFSTTNLDKSSGTHSIKINVSTDKAETITFNVSDISEEGKIIDFNVPGPIILDNSSQVITLSYTVPSDFEFKLGKTYSTIFKANGTNSSEVTQPFSYSTSNEYCSVGNPAVLNIKRIDFDNQGELGEDGKWYPLSEIEVEVEVKNEGKWDVENVEIEWALVRDGEIFMEDTEDDFKLDSSDKDSTIFIIKLDDDVDELKDGDYQFFVKATGTIDDRDAGSLDEEDSCASDFEEVEVILEDDLVIIDNVRFNEQSVVDQASAQCGSDVQVRADVWNIGDDDQDDVEVRIINNELNLNKILKIGDIDRLDSDSFVSSFEIPSNIQEKTYLLTIEVYDEDGDIYEAQDSDDEESQVRIPLTVTNCKSYSEATLTGVQMQTEEAKAGGEIVVTATLTNTGDSSATYTMLISGYSDWASSALVEPSSVTLSAGSNREVTITLNAKEGVSGDKSFSIQTLSEDGKTVINKPVPVTIEGRRGFSLAGIIDESNWYLWVLIALILILIIVIVIVAISVASKARK